MRHSRLNSRRFLQQVYLLEKLLTLPTLCQWKPNGDDGTRRRKRSGSITMSRKVAVDGDDDLWITISKWMTFRERMQHCERYLSPSSPHSPQHETALRETDERIRNADKPRVCLQSYGNPVGSDNRRMQRYSRHKRLLRHFRTVHMDDCHTTTAASRWTTRCIGRDIPRTSAACVFDISGTFPL